MNFWTGLVVGALLASAGWAWFISKLFQTKRHEDAEFDAMKNY